MKITQISIENYVGARRIDIKLSAPVAMLAAKNYSGKSSTIEAVRHAISGDAITGEGARISLKKELSALLSDDSEQGFAEITTDAGTFSIVLPSGKGHHSDDGALPFVLDAQRFPKMTADERRSFLFGLMKVSRNGPAVLAKLKARGCDAAKSDEIAADLRAGFPAAEKAAQGKARDAKASWKTITGGETWGKDKSAGWAAPKPPETYGVEAVKEAENLLAETDAEIEATNQRIGELREAGRLRVEAECRLEELRKTAGVLESKRIKLAHDEAQHAEWTTKLSALPPAAGEKPRLFPCPCCGAALTHRLADGALIEYQGANENTDPDVEIKRKQQQEAVDLFARSVANDLRDIAAAEAAGAEIAEIEKNLGNMPAISPAAEEAKLTELKADRKARNDTLQSMCAANKAAHDADELTRKAAVHHADVLAWLEIADALSPSGIPSELLASALKPINERLAYHSDLAQWERPQITADMDIYTGSRERLYRRLSESEKWRVDGMIAAAIAELSGLRVLLLDRFDVLDAQGREDAIYWLDGMALDGVIDTAIVAGTFKTMPSGLPETIQPVWIENGTAGEIKAAA